jgi:peptidoglycan-N-acetylglucosamine deacetylase
VPERAKITLTVDVEDYAPVGEAVRADVVIQGLLDQLEQQRILGTFFVVGELAESHPEMVRAIAQRGHEVGLHGWRHVPLPHLTPKVFRDDLDRGTKLLEDLTGSRVYGFRAPTFSLVPASHWATDALLAAGFQYSSSVLPAKSPLWGDPTAPRHPFRWPNGLIELPCPVVSFGSVANPYLGGAYLRILPFPLVRYGLAQAAGDELLWLYCHPYDFDPQEPFRPRAELGTLGSRLMWVGRARMHRKVTKVLATRAGAPLYQRVRDIAI